MYSLLNRGIIPRDVDLTPAFERGKAPFSHKQAEMNVNDNTKPPQLRHKIVPGPVKYLKRGRKDGDGLPDPNVAPDASLHRDNVFLTSMNVEDHEILRTTGGPQNLMPEEPAPLHGFGHDNRVSGLSGPMSQGPSPGGGMMESAARAGEMH